ncbi:MAG: hypothetical protein ACOYM3_20460 [Terrimicrobiaceae bacterium]
MRRVTFKSVLEGVATRLGLSPAALLADQAAALAKYLEDRVRDKWELHDWPFTRTLEPRTLSAAPDRYLLLEEPGETPISEVLNAWDGNPELSEEAAVLKYSLSNGRVNFAADAPDEVYLEFSLYHPRFTATAWASGTAYVTGDVVYSATDCYVAAQASTGTAPTAGASSAYWTLQEFPHQLSRYAELGAVADCLNESNQHDKADRMEGQAESKLLDELEKLLVKQKQTPRFAVRNR